MSCSGKVVVVTFIYTSCADACPLLTAKMAGLQDDLGMDFGPKVFFMSITVDPERDTPEVLTRYAQAHGANLSGWAFLTGTSEEIRAVARRYGIYYKKQAGGDVDHTFLTSLVDQHGTLRVQYMGVRFDPDELLRDLQSLLREGAASHERSADPTGRAGASPRSSEAPRSFPGHRRAAHRGGSRRPAGAERGQPPCRGAGDAAPQDRRLPPAPARHHRPAL